MFKRMLKPLMYILLGVIAAPFLAPMLGKLPVIGSFFSRGTETDQA
jgi:hypothetical protein